MSTLHTNSAAGAITRLRDMGLESFLIGSSLLGVIAQRLVRRLCTHCRTTSPLDANEKRCSALWPRRQTRFTARWGANTAVRAAIRAAPVSMNSGGGQRHAPRHP